MDRDSSSSLKLDIIWEIATTHVALLLHHLEPLVPQPPEPTP
jgi:hypothetical protein